MTVKDELQDHAKTGDKFLRTYGDDVVEAGAKMAGKGTIGSLAAKFCKHAGQGVKLFGKRVPMLGAVVTAGFALWEVGENTLKGEFGRAGAALVAGTAETAGNVVGFGVGDLAREAVRQPIGLINENWTPEESGLLSIGKSLVGAGKPDAPKV